VTDDDPAEDSGGPASPDEPLGSDAGFDGIDRIEGGHRRGIGDRDDADGAPRDGTLFVLVAGWTDTARIDGISGAGTGDAAVHTPGVDAELLSYGDVVRGPGVPTSPTGCPSPALVTRAARETLGFDCVVVDGGLAKPTGAATVSVGASPGADVREPDPVGTAPGAFTAAREWASRVPTERLVIGETVPGGTTTALATMRALGEEWSVSSSLPENPLELKREVADEALAASDLAPGEAAHHPELAVRFAGDPVLAVVAGLTVGATEADRDVVLGGGTQLLAAAALVRHAGVAAPLTLATTSYLADDAPDLREAAAALDLDLRVTDPGFERAPLTRFATEAMEGAGMGGALSLADGADRIADVRERTRTLLDDLGLGDADGRDDAP